MHFDFHTFTALLGALVEENLERDASEEQQGGEQKNETGCVFSEDYRTGQPDQLENQQQRGEVYS